MTDKQIAGGSDGRALRLDTTDPVAQALVAAIHAGDVAGVRRLLADQPGLANARLVDELGGSASPRVDEFLAADPPPSAQDITDAFWQACHGGHRRLAEHLLTRGADINGTPSWGTDTPLDVADSHDTNRGLLVSWLRDHGATSSRTGPDKPTDSPATN